MSNSDDLEAIHNYFNFTTPVTPEAQAISKAFLSWYDSLDFIDKMKDDIVAMAKARRNEFNAANNTPANLATAADLTQDQKIAAQAAIAQSKNLTPLQKSTALAASPGIATTPGVPANAVAHKTIQQGSSGPDVITWQGIIGTIADGKFGPATKSATIKWQKDHGLTGDGVVGPKTWSAAIKAPVQEGPGSSVVSIPIVIPPPVAPIPIVPQVGPSSGTTSKTTSPPTQKGPVTTPPGTPLDPSVAKINPAVKSTSTGRYVATAALGGLGFWFGGWIPAAVAGVAGYFGYPKIVK